MPRHKHPHPPQIHVDEGAPRHFLASIQSSGAMGSVYARACVWNLRQASCDRMKPDYSAFSSSWLLPFEVQRCLQNPTVGSLSDVSCLPAPAAAGRRVYASSGISLLGAAFNRHCPHPVWTKYASASDAALWWPCTATHRDRTLSCHILHVPSCLLSGISSVGGAAPPRGGDKPQPKLTTNSSAPQCAVCPVTRSTQRRAGTHLGRHCSL